MPQIDYLLGARSELNVHQIDETANFITTPLNIQYNADNLPSGVGRPINQPISPTPSPALAAPNLDKIELAFDRSVIDLYGPVAKY